MTGLDPVDEVRQVPAYDVQVIRPRETRYVVSIFVLNEGKRLHAQLERMAQASGALSRAETPEQRRRRGLR